MTPTDQDLETLKKVLDIMRQHGVSCLEMGAMKIELGPDTRPYPVSTIDDKEAQLASLREDLQRASEDADIDLYYST